MGIETKVTKLTEHKIIDNLITIWKKIKPSKTYWTITVPTVAFIFSQAKSWKIATVIASYAESQSLVSDYPIFWNIVNAVATEFYDNASWELVWLGIGVLVLVTYSFSKENNSKHQEDDKKISILIEQRIKEEILKQKNNLLLKERFSKLEIQLTKFSSKVWIVQNIDKYIIEEENRDE